MFIDVHTHIDQYEADDLEGLLARARSADVACIVAAGTTISGSRDCIKLAHCHSSVVAAVGVHPQDLTGPLSPAELYEIERLARDPRVVAMSEVGLDHQASSPDRQVQDQALRAQLQIALKARLPVIFHMRDSTADTLRVLQEEGAGANGGAAHYFQGTLADAHAVMDLGFKVSLAKPLLRLPDLQAVARALPIDAIVLETDAYPQYFKSKRERWTESKDVSLVAAKLAELKGLTIDEVALRTTANALEMFGERREMVRTSMANDAQLSPG